MQKFKPSYVVNAAAAAVITIVALLQKPVLTSVKSSSDDIDEKNDDKNPTIPSAPLPQSPVQEVVNDATTITDTSAGVAWHALSGEHCLALLGSSASSGLSSDDSSQRLARTSTTINHINATIICLS